MEILITKAGKDKQILSCKRKDGTVTWKHVSSFFISHDLCHYAVETTLELKHAFFGMVASGTDINDFDLPKVQRNFQLAEEAILAEHLVNLLTIELSQGKMDKFMDIFSGIYEEQVGTNLYEKVTEQILEKIRRRCKELMRKWNTLPVDDTLTLLFEE